MITQDAYVSIRGARTRVYGEASRPEPLVLIDIDSPRFAEPLRNLPPTLLSQQRATLLIRLSNVTRCGEAQVAELRKLVERWDLSPRVAVISHPIGQPPDVDVISGDPLPEDDIGQILAAARAVELEALLEFGHAIWRPTKYHYRLTSGEHCSTYIKLADAIREPRDAEVLATWFTPHLVDRVGLVIDSGTLTPVAQAIDKLLARAGKSLGTVSTLDQYPRAGVDVDDAFNRAADVDGAVLAILSVSSSGILLSRVRNAVAQKATSLSSAPIVIMVDKAGAVHGTAPDAENDLSLGDVIAWTPLPGQQPLAERGTDQPDHCHLCRSPNRARLIPINPFTFDGMLPAQLRRIVPSTTDPSLNRELWEAIKRCNAVAIEARPNKALWKYRSDQLPMSVIVRMERLLADKGLRQKLRDAISKRKREGLRGQADLVLVPEHEMAYEGFADFWEAIAPAFGDNMPEAVPFPPHERFDDELKSKAKAAGSTLVFALGTVTGGSLQHALLGVQTAREHSSGNKLEAFVVHARPAAYRDWSTLLNSFGLDGKQHQLHHGWLTVLPERSPLREEQILLKQLDSEQLESEAAREFHDARVKLTGGSYSGDRAAVLWGSEPSSHLTPDAIYGEHLDGLTTYVATGSAVTAARRAADELAAPELRVFDIAALSRSYYDPLILGSFFRWMRPHETWWGWEPADGEATAKHMIERSPDICQWILIPELLLASAQGKVTRPAAEVVIAAAERLRTTALPQHVGAAIEVGLALAKPTETLTLREGQRDSAVAMTI